MSSSRACALMVLVLAGVGLSEHAVLDGVAFERRRDAVAQQGTTANAHGCDVATGQRAPKGRLTGRVIDIETRQPIGGAVILVGLVAPVYAGPEVDARSLRSALLAEESESPGVVRADGNGRFARDDVPAGFVMIQATAYGYGLGGANQTRRSGVRPVCFVPGTTSEVVVAVRRLGSISGRVLDAEGEPVVGVPVLAHWLATSTGGLPNYAVSPPAMTDDRGVYRIGNLEAREYIVATRVTDVAADLPPNPDADIASMRRQPERRAQWLAEWLTGGPAARTAGAASGVRRSAMVALQKYFFTAGITGAGARAIDLDHLRDVEQIDLVLPPTAGVTVDGVVLDGATPVPRAMVQLTRAGIGAVAGLDEFLGVAESAADGSFTFLGVPPGQYALTAGRSRLSSSPIERLSTPFTPNVTSGGPGPPLYGRLGISVTDAPLSSVVVPVNEGFRFAGRIVFDGADPPSADAVRAWWVESPAAAPFDGIGGSGSDAPVDRTLEFTSIPRPPGRYWLRPTGPGSGWQLRAASVGGRDLLLMPLELADRDVTDIVLTVTNKTSTVRGRAMAPEPRTSAVIVILLNGAVPPKSAIVAPGRRPRAIETDAAGNYQFGELVAGEYLLTAVADADMRDLSDLSFLARVAALATRVTIGERDRQTVDVPVVSVPR